MEMQLVALMKNQSICLDKRGTTGWRMDCDDYVRVCAKQWEKRLLVSIVVMTSLFCGRLLWEKTHFVIVDFVFFSTHYQVLHGCKCTLV